MLKIIVRATDVRARPTLCQRGSTGPRLAILLPVRSSIVPMVEYQLTMTLHSAIRVAFPPADAIALPIGSTDMARNIPLACIVVAPIGFLLRFFLHHLNYICRWIC